MLKHTRKKIFLVLMSAILLFLSLLPFTGGIQTYSADPSEAQYDDEDLFYGLSDSTPSAFNNRL